MGKCISLTFCVSFFSLSPKKSFFYWSQSLLPNHWEIKWLNILHLPRVFAPAQGQLTDEHDILSLRQHDEKPLTIPHVPMDAMVIRSAVCKLIPRWTRPVRRVSSWRSAMSSLTSFRRGGSSLAARSRKGRWGQNINVASILFLNDCLHSVLSKVTPTTIANLYRSKGANGIMTGWPILFPKLWECHSSSFLAFPLMPYLNFTPICPASN